jgi:hypothetical protein
MEIKLYSPDRNRIMSAGRFIQKNIGDLSIFTALSYIRILIKESDRGFISTVSFSAETYVKMDFIYEFSEFICGTMMRKLYDAQDYNPYIRIDVRINSNSANLTEVPHSQTHRTFFELPVHDSIRFTDDRPYSKTRFLIQLTEAFGMNMNAFVRWTIRNNMYIICEDCMKYGSDEIMRRDNSSEVPSSENTAQTTIIPVCLENINDFISTYTELAGKKPEIFAYNIDSDGTDRYKIPSSSDAFKDEPTRYFIHNMNIYEHDPDVTDSTFVSDSNLYIYKALPDMTGSEYTWHCMKLTCPSRKSEKMIYELVRHIYRNSNVKAQGYRFQNLNRKPFTEDNFMTVDLKGLFEKS